LKKFKFSLQPLFEYKQTLERIQKADLKRAQQHLKELREEERRILQAIADNEKSLKLALRRGENVGAALVEHDAYFRYLRDSLKELRLRIVKAEKVRDECQDKLVLTMREIKTYKKLRDEQYQVYLKEVQSEEDKEIGDLVSFKTISETVK